MGGGITLHKSSVLAHRVTVGYTNPNALGVELRVSDKSRWHKWSWWSVVSVMSFVKSVARVACQQLQNKEDCLALPSRTLPTQQQNRNIIFYCACKYNREMATTLRCGAGSSTHLTRTAWLGSPSTKSVAPCLIKSGTSPVSSLAPLLPVLSSLARRSDGSVLAADAASPPLMPLVGKRRA